MQMKPIALATLAALGISSNTVKADDEAMNDGGFFVSPNIPAMGFDSTVNLNSALGGGLGLGFMYGSWAIELMAHELSTDQDFTFADTDVMWYTGDIVYHFQGANRSTPYMRLGFGLLEYDYGTWENDEDIAKFALGYQNWFNENIAFRTELYTTKGMETELGHQHYGAMVSFVYLFGGSGGASSSGGLSTPTVDTDGDRVPDSRDKCVNTPFGARVNSQGCPIDDDFDGVTNANDRCPGTKRNVSVDSRGCPKDSDKDGVIDAFDKCPATAAGVAVNQSGCPEQ